MDDVFNNFKTSLHLCWSCPFKALLEKYSGKEAILYAKVCKASKLPTRWMFQQIAWPALQDLRPEPQQVLYGSSGMGRELPACLALDRVFLKGKCFFKE